MSQTTFSSSMQDITASVINLLDQTLSTGMDVLQVFGKAGADLTAKVNPQIKLLNLPKSGSCCEIPPPCWMPKELGPLSSHACPGATATLRFRVTNCGIESRTILVEADQGATVNPGSLQLGPLQRGWVTVSFTAPASSCDGDCTEILVRVQGCNRFYLRWTVRISKRGCDCCHEIDVEDCPDLVHHWYDHFYCQRPCPPPRGVAGQ
jgi:hypothetical protein